MQDESARERATIDDLMDAMDEVLTEAQIRAIVEGGLKPFAEGVEGCRADVQDTAASCNKHAAQATADACGLLKAQLDQMYARTSVQLETHVDAWASCESQNFTEHVFIRLPCRVAIL